MADYFVYIDETGTLDFREPQTESDSPYFGIGSATFKDEHADILWNMLVLRASLEDQGISLPRGFHAKKRLHEHTRPSIRVTKPTTSTLPCDIPIQIQGI